MLAARHVRDVPESDCRCSVFNESDCIGTRACYSHISMHVVKLSRMSFEMAFSRLFNVRRHYVIIIIIKHVISIFIFINQLGKWTYVVQS